MSNSAPITWFTEDPTPILIAGGLALAVLLVVLFKTGRGVILMAMAGVTLCMALAVLTDYLVVTEREQVEDAVYQAAAAVEHNDVEGVLQVISPSATEMRRQARQWARSMKIEAVHVNRLQISTDHEVQPPTATARFFVRVEGDVTDQGIVFRNPMARMKVDFVFENQRWLATGYERQ